MSNGSNDHDERLTLIEFRQNQHDRVLSELSDAARGIERSLSRLAAIEEKHTLSQRRIDGHEERLRGVELRQALWAGGAVVASTVISLLGPTLLKALGS